MTKGIKKLTLNLSSTLCFNILVVNLSLKFKVKKSKLTTF